MSDSGEFPCIVSGRSCEHNNDTISMISAVNPLLMHWSYNSLALSHRLFEQRPEGCCKLGYPIETHFKITSREISFVGYLFLGF